MTSPFNDVTTNDVTTLSSSGPFVIPGNGYFFSWFSFGASLMYARSAFLNPEAPTYLPVANDDAKVPVLPDPVQGGAGYQTLAD